MTQLSVPMWLRVLLIVLITPILCIGLLIFLVFLIGFGPEAPPLTPQERVGAYAGLLGLGSVFSYVVLATGFKRRQIRWQPWKLLGVTVLVNALLAYGILRLLAR